MSKERKERMLARAMLAAVCAACAAVCIAGCRGATKDVDQRSGTDTRVPQSAPMSMSLTNQFGYEADFNQNITPSPQTSNAVSLPGEMPVTPVRTSGEDAVPL